MRRLSRKNKIEMLIGRLVINLIKGILGALLITGIFYIIGVVIHLMEIFPILVIGLALLNIKLLFNEI